MFAHCHLIILCWYQLKWFCVAIFDVTPFIASTCTHYGCVFERACVCLCVFDLTLCSCARTRKPMKPTRPVAWTRNHFIFQCYAFLLYIRFFIPSFFLGLKPVQRQRVWAEFATLIFQWFVSNQVDFLIYLLFIPLSVQRKEREIEIERENRLKCSLDHLLPCFFISFVRLRVSI